MIKGIIYIFLIMLSILLFGCKEITIETPCDLGWYNNTHFCNEFHSKERIIVIGEIKPNVTKMSFSNFTTNPILLNYSNPEYSPTLNMSNLKYNGKEVEWVYQIERPVNEYIIRIVQCIKIKNGTRYCTE